MLDFDPEDDHLMAHSTFLHTIQSPSAPFYPIYNAFYLEHDQDAHHADRKPSDRQDSTVGSPAAVHFASATASATAAAAAATENPVSIQEPSTDFGVDVPIVTILHPLHHDTITQTTCETFAATIRLPSDDVSEPFRLRIKCPEQASGDSNEWAGTREMNVEVIASGYQKESWSSGPKRLYILEFLALDNVSTFSVVG